MELKEAAVRKLLARKCPEIGLVSLSCSALSGTGYCSEFARVHCKLQKENSTTIESRSFVAKFRKASDDSWTEYDVRVATFPTEIKVLTAVLPVLECLLREAGYPDNESIIGPQYICHGDDQSCIVMEDLKEQGFEELDRLVPWNLTEGAMAIRALARLHGSGFAALERGKLQPQLLVKSYFSRDLKDVRQYYRTNFEIFADIIENRWEKNWLPCSKWLRKKAKTIWTDMQRLCEEDPLDLVSFIHVDFWNCNTMFKMSSDRKPLEIRIIDYQTSTFGSIGWDLITFFVTQANLALYFDSYDEIISIYTNELSRCLTSLNCDAKVADENRLKEELDRLDLVGLLWTVGDLAHIMGQPEELEGIGDLLATSEDSLRAKRTLFENDNFLQTMRRYLSSSRFNFAE